MRVCRRPASCPFAAAPDGAAAADLARWDRLLTATLPGDAALVSALVGDIAMIAGYSAG